MYSLIIIEFAGCILFLGCIIYFFCFPVNRDRFLFGNKSWFGSLIFSCALVTGLILSISLTNQFGAKHKHYVDPYELVNWNATAQEKPDSTFNEDNFYAIVSQFADPGNIPSSHGEARKFALILAMLGIFCLSGLVMSSFVTLLTKRSDKWKQGLIRYNNLFFRNYVVIIGVNEQTATIAKQALARKGVRYVLIQTRQNVENAREKLDLSLNKKEEGSIVFYYAERTSKEDIAALNLGDNALEIYVLGEDMNYENEEDHDAFNINCLEHISSCIEKKNAALLEKRKSPKRLRCHVNLEYQSTFTAFKAAHIYQNLDKIIEFIPFNVHEIWAKKVLVDNFAIVPEENKGEYDVQKYFPIDTYIVKDGKDKGMRKGITKDNVGKNAKSVHLVIFGMNQMGTAFGLQAAIQCHFPNFKYDINQRTTITFIDDQAVAESEFFKGRFEALFHLCRSRTVVCGKDRLEYASAEESFNTEENDPLLNPGNPYAYLKEEGGNFMDIQWEFIQGNVASDEVKKYLEDIARDQRKTLTVAICFNHPQRSIAAALYLPGGVFKNANQVLVYQRNSFDMLNKVAEGENDWKRYSNLFPFGMIESSYTGDTLGNSIAELQNFISSKKEQGNDFLKRLSASLESTQVPEIEKSWAALGLGDKQSNIDLAENIPTKIRSMGISYSGNPNVIVEAFNKDSEIIEALSYAEHMRWVTERLATGYRPLNFSEKDKCSKGEMSNEYFEKVHRAHLRICSNARQAKVSPDSPTKEKNAIQNIPYFLRCAEWLNAIKITQSQDSGRDRILKAFLLHGRNRLSFRYVKAGSVPKGSEELVCNHSFWMADAPLSKYQWYLVTGKDKPAHRWQYDLPAVNISKNDIENFLLILRKRTGLYFTLPSLKEWEYTARLSTGYLADPGLNWHKAIRFSGKRSSSPARARANRRHQKNGLQIYDMLGNVWEWTRERNIDHKDCFYFCGGSWRFKRLECDMGPGKNADPGYWCSFWAPFLASDDLGCRLLWKFDINEKAADDLEKTLSQRQNPTQDNLKSFGEWFARNPLVDVDEGFFIQGTETPRTAEGTTYPENWIDIHAGEDETPHHVVKISKMKVCSVPVTQELWNIVMEQDSRTNPARRVGYDFPQTNISYREIKEKFLPKLNSLAHDSEFFNGILDTDFEFRLPTESEWEYMSKGAHTSELSKELTAIVEKEGRIPENIDDILSRFEPYKKYSGSDNAAKVAWFGQNCLQPVGRKKPFSKEFRVFDMSGNVWEWVDDFYQTDFYNYCMGKTRDGKTVDNKYSREYRDKGYVSNPICEDPEYSAHVFRGGSWILNEFESRCTRPNYWEESYKNDDLGFRIVLAPKRK